MHPSNLIHGLTFDLVDDSGELGSDALAEWLRAVLLPVIDETLEQHDQPQRLCRIERLEIDLGKIPREDMEGELARRLHEQLSAALNWSSAPLLAAGLAPVSATATATANANAYANAYAYVNAHATAVAGAAVVTFAAADAGPELLSFLRSGRLPWSVAVDQQTAHEHLMHRVLISSVARPVLKTAIGDQQMLTRLVRQFAPSTLMKVVQALHGRSFVARMEIGEQGWLTLIATGPSLADMLPIATAQQDTNHARAGNEVTPVSPSALLVSAPGNVVAQATSGHHDDMTRVHAADQALSKDVATPNASPQPSLEEATRSLAAADSARGAIGAISSADSKDSGAVNTLAPSRTQDAIIILKMLEQVVCQADAEEMRRILPEVASSLKLELMALWRGLPIETQRQTLAHFNQHQRERLTELLQPAPPEQGNVDHVQQRDVSARVTIVVDALKHDDVTPLAAVWARATGPNATFTIDMVEQSLRQADAMALTRVWPKAISELARELRALWLGLSAGKRRQYRRVLNQDQIWRRMTAASREELKLQWQRLSDASQHEYRDALAGHVAAGKSSELAGLVRLLSNVSRHSPEALTIARNRYIADTSVVSVPPDGAGTLNMVEQSLREVDAVALEPIMLIDALKQNDAARLAETVILIDGGIARTEPASKGIEGIEGIVTIDTVEQALLQPDATVLTRVSPDAFSERGLSGENQHDYREALVEHSTAEQSRELAELVRLLSNASTKPAPAGHRQPEDLAMRITMLIDALKRSDTAQLAKIWPGMNIAERNELKSQWLNLSGAVQHESLEPLGRLLVADQFNEVAALLNLSANDATRSTVTLGMEAPARAGSLSDGGILDSSPTAESGTGKVAIEAVEQALWLVASLTDTNERGLMEATSRNLHPSTSVEHVLSEESELMRSEQTGGAHSQIDPALAMFRDWQHYKVDLPHVKLTLTELRQWLNWWLMHDARLVNQDCSLMLEAIESQCAQVNDPVLFMKLVLMALREEEALDLDALSLQAMSMPVTVDKPAAMDAIGTLKSQQAIRNFVEQQMSEEAQLAGLNSAQLHQLVRAWISDAGSLFLLAIEDQALQSGDIHEYFRSILQSLLNGETIDLECLVEPVSLVTVMPVDIVSIDGADNRGGTSNNAVTATTASTVMAEQAPGEPSPLPLLLRQSLPKKLADAFLGADLRPLQIIWPEIMRFHTDVVTAAARRYLRRPQERANLVRQSEAGMIMALVKAISPATGRQFDALVLHADRCAAVLPEPLAPDEFRQRVLGFAVDRALDGGDANSWLGGLMQALEVARTRTDDVAHAWRAMLPTTPALDHALFAARYLTIVEPGLQETGEAPALHAMLLAELSGADAGLAEAPARDKNVSGQATTNAHKPAAGNVRGVVDNSCSSEAVLAMLLMRSSGFGEVEDLVTGLLLERLLTAEGVTLTGALESALCQPSVIERLIDSTPGPALAQLMLLLQPELAAQLPAVLSAIVNGASVANVPAMQDSRMWRAIYQSAFVAADPVTPAEFIRSLMGSVSEGNELPLPQPVVATSRTATLQTLFQPMKTTQAGQQSQQQDLPELTGESNIRNAGMVIFATYMQRLFGILELTKDGHFVNDEAAQRAIHLLQYAVTGDASTPEYQLVLNKLFCGIHGGLPIVRSIDITPREKEIIEQMLNGVITHWNALGKTSIAGLRQTFLQREGHLYFEEDAWHLKIQQATFDMLLDRLPWSFSMIKFPWMEHPLHVTWR